MKKKLLAVLVILVILVIVVDRVGEYLAERYITDELETMEGFGDRPQVEIDGFPFLTQLIRNRFSEVEVTVRDIPLQENDGPEVTMDRLDAAFSDVTRTDGEITATTVRGDGLISYDDLSDYLGIEVVQGEGGTVAVADSPDITATPDVIQGPAGFERVVAFDEPVSADGGAVPAEVTRAFAMTIPGVGFPFEVNVRDVRVAEDGLHLDVRGSDLRYGR